MTAREEWRQAGGSATLIGSAFGLVSEAEALERLLGSERFDRILLAVPQEDLENIGRTAGEPPLETDWEMDDLEEVYLEQLGRFGKTELPPREPYLAFRWARSKGVPLEAIDIPDALHTETYAENVSVFEHIGKSRRQRKLASRASEEKDLGRFVRAWDDVFFPTRGLRRVEAARCRAMADAIRRATALGGRVLAVLPLERFDGVLAELRQPTDTSAERRNP